MAATPRKFQKSVKAPTLPYINRYNKLREIHQVGIFIDLRPLCAEFTVLEPELRRLILPFNNLSRKLSGKGSGLGGGGVTGSRAGLCGGVGWPPVDDNASQFANWHCELG
jgi:hypothetical protein